MMNNRNAHLFRSRSGRVNNNAKDRDAYETNASVIDGLNCSGTLSAPYDLGFDEGWQWTGKECPFARDDDADEWRRGRRDGRAWRVATRAV